jgi:hypothetical protein
MKINHEHEFVFCSNCGEEERFDWFKAKDKNTEFGICLTCGWICINQDAGVKFMETILLKKSLKSLIIEMRKAV